MRCHRPDLTPLYVVNFRLQVAALGYQLLELPPRGNIIGTRLRQNLSIPGDTQQARVQVAPLKALHHHRTLRKTALLQALV